MVDDIQVPLLPMTPRHGKGKELMNLLRTELGIPKGVKWFEVRFAMNEAISVKLEYMPGSREVESDAG